MGLLGSRVKGARNITILNGDRLEMIKSGKELDVVAKAGRLQRSRGSI
jgi:hypothetical protein